ncbi:CYTH domain-containing protein [Vogesella indigofera]|uniref:CYTH domain-containing protein n=1 Tax=Vogesella indigofera TaxID=45465 RepID=UPI00234EC580|nr:CYTH domain-containing protein [Vogesella indigofera]MDC7700327.1 CYTH domain-containing protein [Vogesella indigofera]
MALETELKFSLLPSHNAAFRRLMASHVPGTAPTTTLYSVYYDTPSLALMQQGMGLRLRQVDGHWLQTLKFAEQAGAGLHQRLELEKAVSGPVLELDQITDRKARRFLTQHHIASVLAPLFTTTIRRQCWTLQDGHGNSLEVSLDHGTIEGQGQTLKVNEVEIELKQGQTQALFDLALKLASSLPLTPHPQSKPERGYALYCDVWPLTPSKAQLPTLSATMTPQSEPK